MRDARSVPTEERREILLDACLHHRAKDPQLDGDRGHWLARVLEAAGDLEVLAPRILASPEPPERGWDLHQRIELACEFARRSVPGAREWMYAQFDRTLESTEPEEPDLRDTVFAYLARADGFDGLRHATRALGARLRSDSSFLVDAYALSRIEDHLGESAVLEWMTRESAVDANVAEFHRRTSPGVERGAAPEPDDRDDWKDQRERDLRDLWSPRRYASVREGWLARKLTAYQVRTWNRYSATDEDIAGVLQGLRVDVDPRLLAGGLQVFAGRVLPLEFVPRAIELFGHEDHDVGTAAVLALELVTDERVHQLALQVLRESECDWWSAMRLLKANYRAEDADLLRTVLPTGAEPWMTHDAAFGLIDILERWGTPREVDLLAWCFEWAACENCRGRAVERMQALSVLPDEIAEEARYDSSVYVREAVACGPVPFDAPLPPDRASADF